MPFNPNNYLIKLKGKDYLEVKWRLVWFREDHPDWGIETNVVSHTDKLAIVRAQICNDDGHVLATGTKSETPQGFADYLEKAETGAVGRALGMLGYGTQFAPEFDEGDRIVDSPVLPRQSAAPSTPDSPPANVQKLVDAARKVFGEENVTVTDEGPEAKPPEKKDGPHPNSNKATIAIARTIAIAADRAGLKTDTAKHATASEFYGRPITSFFDIGEKVADYQPFLKHLTELAVQNGGSQ